MAHGFINLGTNTSFVSRKELAWHRLGKTVDAMSSAECIKLAGLDFTVELAPLLATIDKPLSNNTAMSKNIVTRESLKEGRYELKESLKVPNRFATYRNDSNIVLGTVGNRYEVIQNIEAFDFFDSVIGQGHAKYETAGALGNGETVFITAKLPEHLKVKGEEIDKYLLFTMSHDGSSSITIMFTPIRVVCNNTLSAALHSKEKITIRHTRNARERLDIAPKLLGIDREASKMYEDVFNRFKTVSITDDQLGVFIDKVFDFKYEDISDLSARSVNKRNALFEYYASGVGQAGTQGTLWGAFNMVTGYLQNGSNKDSSKQFESEFLKGNGNTRAKAMSELLQLA